MHMKKYVVSILTLIMIFGLSADVLHNTEAAGNYKIGEIKYIANDCTNISCTDEMMASPLPSSIEATSSDIQKFNKNVYGNDAFREHQGIDRHINSYSSTLTRWVDPEQLECMALNIYFESAVEPLAGKLAVSQVVLNRVKERNCHRRFVK